MIKDEHAPNTMMRLAQLSAVALLALSCCLAGQAHARQNKSLVEIDVKVEDGKGNPVRQKIPLVIFRDDTIQRAPFLLLGHGRPQFGALRTTPGHSPFPISTTRYLVSLGYVVLVPTRIGYHDAGGPDVEDSGPCTTKNYPPAYEAGASQSVSVISYAKSLPYVDASRGLIVGQSFGGTLSIALAAKNVPGVRAAVNFAGGGGGNPGGSPGQPCRPERLKALFASYGATSRIPTQWFYSENDQYFGNLYPHQWFEAFKAQGGKGEFVRLPAHGSDGHPSFTRNPTAWRPAFERFLKGL